MGMGWDLCPLPTQTIPWLHGCGTPGMLPKPPQLLLHICRVPGQEQCPAGEHGEVKPLRVTKTTHGIFKSRNLGKPNPFKGLLSATSQRAEEFITLGSSTPMGAIPRDC